MVELSTVSAGVELGKGVWALLEYVRSVAGTAVISAYFKHDGTRVEGSDKIAVELHPQAGKSTVWWYSVRPLDDYTFLRACVNPAAAYEIIGQEVGEPLPDSRYWRWIAPTLPGRIYGGGDPPNLKVDFLVFGYRPKALLKHFVSE